MSERIPDLDIALVTAWRRGDPKIAKDATAFWRRLGALPPSETPEARVKQLCVAAYMGEALIGVSTVVLTNVPLLRCRLGMFRCLVDPEQRQRQVARGLAVASRDALAVWSRDNPAEKIMGMATIVESPALEAFSKQPVWRASGLTLVGYRPDGRQLRVVWFDHARLD